MIDFDHHHAQAPYGLGGPDACYQGPGSCTFERNVHSRALLELSAPHCVCSRPKRQGADARERTWCSSVANAMPPEPCWFTEHLTQHLCGWMHDCVRDAAVHPKPRKVQEDEVPEQALLDA